MASQTTNRVLMIRPASFGFNPETAVSNTFQVEAKISDPEARAVGEFDRFVARLREAGVTVEVVEDTPSPAKPDAVFPNNWVSFHEAGEAVIYPMANRSRQEEVRPDILAAFGYRVALDLRNALGKCLEGTGSLVLERNLHLAFACRSPRTDEDLVARFCAELGFKAVLFDAYSGDSAIYHTNVVMAIGERTAIICLDVCDQRDEVQSALEQAGKHVLTITEDQMNHFAGNMLQLRGQNGPIWVMSLQAWNALNTPQKEHLRAEAEIVTGDLTTIETLGGGSARCMIAELF